MTTAAAPTPEYTPHAGVSKDHVLETPDGKLPYHVEANWILLKDKEEKPIAEVFFCGYTVKKDGAKPRPLTFVFNGGPGAASAYLHLGALGPRRVLFSNNGEVPPSPASVGDNAESWLSFTDLVFIDPVGTGLSRNLPEPSAAKDAPPAAPKKNDPKDFFAVNRDLDSLCEFIQKYLTRTQRWSSPIYLAGESYGGFRVAKLTRRLQTNFGIGLSGAILISPALEWPLLSTSDYDVVPWLNLVPTMAAVAHHHGLCKAAPKGASLEQVMEQAEAFADTELASLLLQGSALPDETRKKILTKLSDWSGVPYERIEPYGGRVGLLEFARLLLKDQRKVCGYYDGTLTAEDPFPDRAMFEGPDPTLEGLDRVFSTGINIHLREFLQLSLDRAYTLLSLEVNTAWKHDGKDRHVFDIQMGGTDDLRYALSLNPHMKVLITHGYQDLVTPYFASNRIVRQMKLSPAARERVKLQHFAGGHMFYTWEKSRKAFTAEAKKIYSATK